MMRNHKCPLSDNQAALRCQSVTLIDDHGVSRADWRNNQTRGKEANCFFFYADANFDSTQFELYVLISFLQFNSAYFVRQLQFSYYKKKTI